MVIWKVNSPIPTGDVVDPFAESTEMLQS